MAIGAFAQTSLFSEDFEGGAMPDGWTTEGPGSWSVGTGDYSNSTGAGNGSYNALITHNASGNVTKLITPEIDLSSVTSAELSFMHVQRSWAGDYDYLKLYYRASSDDSWVEIASYTSLYASWTTEEDIVLSNTSSTYQLAFEMTDNYGYGVGIDDIQIIQHSSCSRPAALAAALTAGNGTIATLSWTESGTATDWVVEYSTAADFTGAVSENVTGTPSINITGLTAETTYYARVKAICGGGEESNWCNAINFTPTNAYSITVNDGTATNGYVPVYGYYVDNYSRSQFIIPASALTDIQWSSITHLTFYSSSGSIDWGSAEFDVRLKEVNYTTISSLEDWNDMELVYHGNLGISGNVMEVTFDTPYTYLGGNLVIGTNETTSGSWSSCSWYGVAATGASLGGYGSSVGQQNFLPKVTIEYIPGEAPTCFKPTALAVSNIGNYNATLTWTAGADETAWQVMINDDEDGIVDVEDTPTYEMTNLTPESTYSVKVRAYCDIDDQSDWSDVVTFTTLSSCPIPAGVNASNITATTADINWTGFNDSYVVRYRVAADMILFSDDFENGMNEGWTTIDSDGDGFNWESHINIGTGNHGTHSGDGVLTSASYDADNGVALTPDNWLITPAIDLPNDAQSIILQFYANGQDAAYAEEHYGVYISTTVADDTDAFTLLWEETMNANGGPHREEGVYGEKNTDLTAYAGETVYIAIRHFGVTDQFYINIDDVSVFATNEENEWVTINADASPVELTGLTPNTTYEYQVMGICGSEETAWTEITVFTTSVSCQSPTALEVSNVTANSATLAWTAGADETAWQICINNDLDNLIDADSNTFELTNLNPDSNYAVSVRAVCGTDDESEWSNTVAFTTLPTCIVPTDLTVSDVTAHTATITWAANGSETAWQISINGDEDDLVDVDNTSYTMTDLPGDSNYYVKVRAYCDVDDQSAWTSPVPFTTLPSCTVPTDIEFTNVTATSATVSWTAGASETIWNLQYKLLSDADWTEVNGLTTNSYEITGLTAASAYSVRVQADCETEGTSTWLSGALMTLVSCPVPTDLEASNVTATTATITWTAGGEEAEWTLQYGTDNTFADYAEITSTTTIVDLTELTQEAVYYARVKANCGEGDESQWSAVCTFNPSAATTIGTADAAAGYLPTYILYNYSYTQQIYTADEIGTAGTILSVAFYGQSVQTRNLDVYMVATDKTNFESATDWIIVSENDMVFSGSVDFAANVWTTITLTTPFTYDGTSNLAIIVDDNTGTWTSSIQFNVYNVESNQSLYYYRDASDIDPANPSVDGTLFAKKNQIRLLIDSTPTYTITATAGENGTITPSGAVTVTEGADKEFTITADENYRILSVVVDDADVTAAVVENNGVYTFTNVTANHTIAATFVAETAVTYTITASAGEHGTITPSGAVSVVEGEDQSFVITPDADYRIDVLTVDGEVVTLSESEELGYVYAFTNVVAGHTINVTFTSLNNVEINAAASMAVYPNPNNGMFSIDFSNIEGEATYLLIDARGAVVETCEINVTNGETKMFNHTLTAGTYFVRIINGDKVYVEQIVVE